MPVIRIEDEFVTYEVDGEVIAGPVSTRVPADGGRPRPRWMEAVLYRKGDGSYVLHTVNRSLVWHLTEQGLAHVRKPVETDYENLPEDAVYCGALSRGEKCSQRSPSWPGRVLVEEPQHKMVSCPDAGAVIRQVTTARRGDGSVSVALSEPMRELLTEAEEHDPAFRIARPVMTM